MKLRFGVALDLELAPLPFNGISSRLPDVRK